MGGTKVSAFHELRLNSCPRLQSFQICECDAGSRESQNTSLPVNNPILFQWIDGDNRNSSDSYFRE